MEINVVVTEPLGEPQPQQIVFVHGAWHGAWCWYEHFTEFFADHGYASYSIDLRGHGGSDGSVRAARIAHYVHDVRRLVLELDHDPVLVGHSMGGLVVQQYLSQYRAAAGVLLAPVPVKGAIGATMRVIRDHPVAFLRANISLSLGPIVDDPHRAISLLFGPQMRAADARRYVELLQDESYPAYLEMIIDLARTSRVHDPMLVLGAQFDAIFSPAEIKATARAYNTEAVIFGGMGHDMMLEPGWEGPARTILDWLNSVNLGRH
ncbi:MAG: alpha/beta hydrolase [Acidimicrobiia bacterium]|nr:MAG: alpha/beta hydrolase [Acidimicrobiia bacterium]